LMVTLQLVYGGVGAGMCDCSNYSAR
jgi:hypothetical protein